MRVSWLLEVLTEAGLPVVEQPGWRGRGGELRAVHGVVCHHTVTGPSVADDRVSDLLRDGRSDLRGPLSQLGLDRAGRFHLIADGRCSHNGYGTWGNDSIGIEAFNDGQGEPWPPEQYDAYARGCAAIIAHLGFGVDRVRGHKETDPKRKIDPSFDMNEFRQRVAARRPGDEELTVAQIDDILRKLDALSREQKEQGAEIAEIKRRVRSMHTQDWEGGSTAFLDKRLKRLDGIITLLRKNDDA